jgi:hypothetical protein
MHAFWKAFDMTDYQLFKQDSSLVRIYGGLPVANVVKALDKSKLWELNTWRQDDAWGMQDTKAVMFRWADGNSFDRVRDSTSVVDTGVFNEIPEAEDLVMQALSCIESTELGRVFAIKLKPGGRVFPHADVGIYSDKFERFHICLKSDPGFFYYTQHPLGPVQQSYMAPGEFWWFNHKRVHWAYNGGKDDRISIVLDCVAPKWKRNRDVLALRTYDGGKL